MTADTAALRAIFAAMAVEARKAGNHSGYRQTARTCEHMADMLGDVIEAAQKETKR